MPFGFCWSLRFILARVNCAARCFLSGSSIYKSHCSSELEVRARRGRISQLRLEIARLVVPDAASAVLLANVSDESQTSRLPTLLIAI